jgi:ferritin-like metal-binding protein YciE/nucleoside-diphosphate-sugar epimerase
MRVIVIGATGNVGTSVIEALVASPQVDEAVGISRRRPTWSPPKTTWVETDILDPGLSQQFDGADVVIHLAWAIQPSRDGATLERINVEGSGRVFDAVAAAGVPKLVYASSVGAYSAGPKDRKVDESWPTGGIATSFYSRHKAAVERLLDRFEEQNPDTDVVRLRPALIFKGDAATEIRRLFIGPFLPNFLVSSNLVPAVPRLRGLRFQAVHSRDVGQAYLKAAVGDARGAYNIAAEPTIGPEELADVFDARTFPMPAGLARRLTDISWRLRLQPTPPGWLDMALNVPLMSTARAREDLGWTPRHSSVEAMEELLEGIRRGSGHPTPPLETAGAKGRIDEVRTGVGGRQWRRDREEQLVKYLADVHSIEQQALVQMRGAPGIAGDERIAELFRHHLAETEGHERRVRERLEAHGADPSTLKDAAGKAGGYGMLLFARAQPDTPGLLSAHAFSYEHMELAAYALLERVAEAAGDEETARLAREIAAEERAMAERLEGFFDIAVEASVSDSRHDDIETQLVKHLADAHALEQQAKRLLESGPKLVDDEALANLLAEHYEETLLHEKRLEERLQAHDASPSTVKDAALSLGGLNVGGFFGAQPDTTTKLAGFAYAFEHIEIGSYELLKRVALMAGDEETVEVVDRTLAEERAAAERIASAWDRPGVPLGVAS